MGDNLTPDMVAANLAQIPSHQIWKIVPNSLDDPSWFYLQLWLVSEINGEPVKELASEYCHAKPLAIKSVSKQIVKKIDKEMQKNIAALSKKPEDNFYGFYHMEGN